MKNLLAHPEGLNIEDPEYLSIQLFEELCIRDQLINDLIAIIEERVSNNFTKNDAAVFVANHLISKKRS